jgi:heme A synthase
MAKMSGDHKINMDAVASKTRGMAGIITQVSGATIMLGGLPQSTAACVCCGLSIMHA